MNKKIIWIGGPKGVGKSTLIKKSIPHTTPVLHTGQLAIDAEKMYSKNPRWKKMPLQRKLEIINRYVSSTITKMLKENNSIVLDSHFSFKGKPLVPNSTLEKLTKTPNVEFLLVHLTASRREILLRLLADTEKSRSEVIKEVREDILLNKKFYEEYSSFLSKRKTVRSVTLWNKKIEETSDLLKGVVGDFISERWKNSFLVKVDKSKGDTRG